LEAVADPSTQAQLQIVQAFLAGIVRKSDKAAGIQLAMATNIEAIATGCLRALEPACCVGEEVSGKDANSLALTRYLMR